MIFNHNLGWLAKLKASMGHILPTGRMLCMPGLEIPFVKTIENVIRNHYFEESFNSGKTVFISSMVFGRMITLRET